MEMTKDKILYKVEFFFCKRLISAFFFSSQSSFLSQAVFAFSMPCSPLQLLILDRALHLLFFTSIIHTN